MLLLLSITSSTSRGDSWKTFCIIHNKNIDMYDFISLWGFHDLHTKQIWAAAKTHFLTKTDKDHITKCTVRTILPSTVNVRHVIHIQSLVMLKGVFLAQNWNWRTRDGDRKDIRRYRTWRSSGFLIGRLPPRQSPSTVPWHPCAGNI